MLIKNVETGKIITSFDTLYGIFLYLCTQNQICYDHRQRQRTERTALGINPELLVNMQTRYNMSLSKQKKSLVARLLNIKKACAAML